MIEVVPAAAEHIAAIAADPRPADAAEIAASSGSSMEAALARGLASSTVAYTVLLDGKPVAMLGAVAYSAMAGIGIAWMLGSAALDCPAARRAIVRFGPAVLDHLRDHYPGMLFNAVDARNRRALRFLKWLGFTVMDPQPTGRDGAMFHPFYVLGAPDDGKVH